jgi:hypothetical protein
MLDERLFHRGQIFGADRRDHIGHDRSTARAAAGERAASRIGERRYILIANNCGLRFADHAAQALVGPSELATSYRTRGALIPAESLPGPGWHVPAKRHRTGC